MSTERPDIPSAIIAGIRKRIEEIWDDEPDMLEDMIEQEIEAYQDLQSLEIEGVPGEVLRELLADAEREHPTDYYEQREFVRNGADRYLYVQQLNEKVGPIKELLIRMEDIISNECYNQNIQNYGSGGVWEGEGRSFRYPITFIVDDKDEKRRNVSSAVDTEILMTGRYKFGSNELNIFRALAKIVEMLQAEYNFPAERSK